MEQANIFDGTVKNEETSRATGAFCVSSCTIDGKLLLFAK